jgi:serine/threonine protein kinase
MLTPDTVLQGRYRIVRQLGQGGMGAVFEAVDERLDTTVALKETFFADERLRKQFEREARLLARLHHPALPRVSDHFSEAEGQFLVMQFIGGEDLAEMIARRRGAFPEQQVLSWADQLLDALDYLHTQDPQIIHRDIKPQNLKLTSRGQIILLDFGLAKGQASEVSRVTTSASIFGYTPNYAPLEQVQGLGTDPRSDIYALSATLYHLLTGTKPPDALTRAAAIVNGQADPLLLANEANSVVSVETAKVLEKAMSQNREHRYSSAAAMRKAFQNSGDTQTISSRTEANTVLFPPSAPSTAPVTQHNLVEGTVAVANPPTVRPGETTVVRPLVAERRKRSPLVWAALGVVLCAVVGLGYYAYQKRAGSQSNSAALAEPTVSPAVVASPEQNATVVDQQPSPSPASSPAQVETAITTKKETPKERPTQRDRTNTTTAQDEPDEPPDEPEVPDINNPDVPIPQGHPTVRRQPGGVVIRTFPDGTQLLTMPDGTRVITRPDGTRQIINPRRLRRRNAPRY